MHDIDRTMLELESEGFANEHEGFSHEQESEFEDAAAQRFLELESEEELEGFLGGLLSRALGAVGGLVRNPAVQNTIKSTVKGALASGIPSVAGAIGKRYFGDQGATWGERAGKGLSAMLGLEDGNELEVARRVTRTVVDAARRVEPLVRKGQPVQIAARNAVNAALSTHLPGIATVGARPQSGRWIRENGKVVILGV